jgi:type II secretory pathway component PulK
LWRDASELVKEHITPFLCHAVKELGWQVLEELLHCLGTDVGQAREILWWMLGTNKQDQMPLSCS